MKKFIRRSTFDIRHWWETRSGESTACGGDSLGASTRRSVNGHSRCCFEGAALRVHAFEVADEIFQFHDGARFSKNLCEDFVTLFFVRLVQFLQISAALGDIREPRTDSLHVSLGERRMFVMILDLSQPDPSALDELWKQSVELWRILVVLNPSEGRKRVERVLQDKGPIESVCNTRHDHARFRGVLMTPEGSQAGRNSFCPDAGSANF